MTGKFTGVIRKAREGSGPPGQEHDQQSGIPVNQETGKPVNQSPVEAIDYVNLSIRVPRSLRQHWAVEAKRTGTSLTREIIESLEQKFGRPDGE